MFFKRKSKEVMLDFDRKDFEIFQMPKALSGLKKVGKTFTRQRFISPVFGQAVVDEPIKIRTKGSSDILAYDAFRTDETKMIKEDEVLKKHGTRYYEFQVVSSQPRKNNVVDPEILRKNAFIPSEELQVEEDEEEIVENKELTFPEELPDIDYQDEELEPIFINPIAVDTIEESYDEELSFDEESFFEAPKKAETEVYIEDGVRKLSITPPDFLEEAKMERNAHKVEVEKIKKMRSYEDYKLPSIDLLKDPIIKNDEDTAFIESKIEAINHTLIDFGIEGSVCDSTIGPAVTRYEIKLAPGVKVQKILQIESNLKMNLSAKSIIIEAPIPGKSTVGIEVPNDKLKPVYFKSIVNNEDFLYDGKPLRVALGLDIDGNAIYSNIAKMPHGLVAGASGSGKSVCMNTILVSLLMKNKPTDLKMLLIDPKQVELAPYNEIPHLITPVISDPKTASMALKWCVDEMERRYTLFRDSRTREINSYNEKMIELGQPKLPYIIIVIDEFADILMVAGADFEDSIQRLTQKARACGMHMLLATQRPDANTIKGSIKSNIPARIAFKVATGVDSNVILDRYGAENLLGYGDMLLKDNGEIKRVQGAYLSDDEIYAVTDFIRSESLPDYFISHDILEQNVKKIDNAKELDELLPEVAHYVVTEGVCSLNNIQMAFNLGWPRAKSLVQTLESLGIVSEKTGSTKGREVLVDEETLDSILGEVL